MVQGILPAKVPCPLFLCRNASRGTGQRDKRKRIITGSWPRIAHGDAMFHVKHVLRRGGRPPFAPDALDRGVARSSRTKQYAPVGGPWS